MSSTSEISKLPRGLKFAIRTLKAVLSFASKDGTRYNRNTVAFDAEGRTIATDGHTLIVHSPSEVGAPSWSTAKPEAPDVAVERSVICDMIKGAGIKSTVEFVDSDCGSSAVAENGAAFPTMTSDRCSIEYPAWRQILPQINKDEAVTVHLDARYLKRVAEAAIALVDGKRGDMVRIKLTLDKSELEEDGRITRPLQFDQELADGAHVLSIVMPIRKSA